MARAAFAPDRTPRAARRVDDAGLLATLVHDCLATGVRRRALLLRLSLLPADFLKPHHMRLIRQALAPLAMADHGRRFELDGGDIAVVWRGDAAAALGTTLDAVRLMFADDVPPATELAVVLALPQDAARMLAVLDGDHACARPSPTAAPTTPLNPAELAALEAGLAQADVTRFARRRAVWEILHGYAPRLRWEERYLSVSEIATALAPERSLRADPWLFRRLTRTLDRRMLSLLCSGELREAGPFALNLNVASVLAPEFLRFDAILPASLRGQVVIDFSPADILADLAAFTFARDFAHARGYRCGMDAPAARSADGQAPALAPALALAPLGLDLLRLRWSPALARHDGTAIARLAGDPARVVLYDADRPTAIDWGTACGIRLFQGRAASVG